MILAALFVAYLRLACLYLRLAFLAFLLAE
jgi:hypothetical protein